MRVSVRVHVRVHTVINTASFIIQDGLAKQSSNVNNRHSMTMGMDVGI